MTSERILRGALGCGAALVAVRLFAGAEQLGGLFNGLLLAPVLMLLVAVPILRRVAPDEPAPLKVLLFSALFSPALVAGVWMLAGATGALVFSLVVLLLGSLDVGQGKRSERLGAGQLAALGLSAACALVVGLALFDGEAARASFHGLLHSAIVQATAAGMPPENPWLAGVPLGYYWIWHGLGAAFGELLGFAPTRALALLNVWAAATLPLSLYFFAAPLWQRARTELVAVALGLVGLNLLGGFAWVSAGAEFTAPTHWMELLGNMRGLAFGGMDPRVAWGPSKFGNLSSYPAALALLAGGLVAAGHGLREVSADGRAARKVWCGLTAGTLGLATLINPLVGGAGLMAAGLVALLNKRMGLLGLLFACAAPGVVLALVAGSSRTESGLGFELSSARLIGMLWALLPLLIGAVLCAVFCRPREAGARAFFELAWAGALTSMLVAAVVILPEGNEYKFVRTAALCLAPLAAGAPFALGQAGRGIGLLGGALGLVWIAGAGLSGWLGLRNYGIWSSQSAGIDERAGHLLPSGESPLSEAMGFLRKASEAAPERPVLIVNPPSQGGLGLDYGGGSFVDGNNLQGHSAAAFSGMAVFCDRRSYLVDADPAWLPRLNIVRSLFAGVAGSPAALKFELAQPGLAGRSAFLLANEGELGASKAGELGWQECWRRGDWVILQAP